MCWNSVDYNCVSCASQPRPRSNDNDEPITKYANHGMINSHRTKPLRSKQCSCSYPQHDAHSEQQQQYSLKKTNWALKVKVIIRLTCNSCNYHRYLYVYAERKLLQHFVIYAALSYLFLCLLSYTISFNLNIKMHIKIITILALDCDSLVFGFGWWNYRQSDDPMIKLLLPYIANNCVFLSDYSRQFLHFLYFHYDALVLTRSWIILLF